MEPAMLLSELPAELLQHIASYIPATHIALAFAPTCRALRKAARNALNDISLLAVTSTTANSVVLLYIDGSVVIEWDAKPPRRIKTRSGGWATGIACGEDMSLHVGQYSAHGLLTFALPRDVRRAEHARAGYSYERSIQTAPSPEGVVCAHGIVYSVGIDPNGFSSVWRHTLAGTEVEKRVLPAEFEAWGIGCAAALWGIGLTPANDFLLIAAHESDNPASDEPTRENTGRVLAVGISRESGSFEHDPVAVRDWDAAGLSMPPLNRPSDLACCSHGYLFVASFSGYAFDRKRVIYKLALSEDRTMGGKVCCFALPDDYMAHGLCTCPQGNVIYATAHRGGLGVKVDSAIFSFACGCNDAGEHAEVPRATKLADLPGAHCIAHVPCVSAREK